MFLENYDKTTPFNPLTTLGIKYDANYICSPTQVYRMCVVSEYMFFLLTTSLFICTHKTIKDEWETIQKFLEQAFDTPHLYFLKKRQFIKKTYI